jgi:hypothetical protein
MMKPVSEALMDLLVRQGMARGRAGTRTVRGKTNASSLEALSVMGWANALLDREESEIEQMHSPAGGEEDRRMGISVAGGTRPPAVGGSVNVHEPSPSPKARPVLRIVVDNGRRRRAQRGTGTLPRLTLHIGGKV